MVKSTMKNLLVSTALLCLSAGAVASSLSVSVVDKEAKPVLDAVVVVLPVNKSVLPALPLSSQATVVQEKCSLCPSSLSCPQEQSSHLLTTTHGTIMFGRRLLEWANSMPLRRVSNPG